VAIPNVVGTLQAAATQALTGAGYAIGSVTSTSDAAVPSGHVISTNPPSGTAANTGAKVDLVVSTGPKAATIPNVVGLSQAAATQALTGIGYVIGTVTSASDPAVPPGDVIKVNPPSGSAANAGSKVDLVISTGPKQQIIVPDVIGYTRQTGEVMLKQAGFQVGTVKSKRSEQVPLGGIDNTSPAAGEMADQGSAVNLEVSSGTNSWSASLPIIVFSIFGLALLLFIGYGIAADRGQNFLKLLADRDFARGLITFLIAIATVGIAIILAISSLVSSGDKDDDRFDRGKQVLTILIGVLGTIVGFYFGSSTETKSLLPDSEITTTVLPDATEGQIYQSTLEAPNLTKPLTWSVSPNLPNGLSLEATTGEITGTPKKASGANNYFFKVTDSSMPRVTSARDLEFRVLPRVITTQSAPDGTVDKPYAYKLDAPSLTAPLAWSVAPLLPDGLTLDSTTGQISGTPTKSTGKITYKFTVVDSATPPATASAEIKFEIK